jgi:protein MAK11
MLSNSQFFLTFLIRIFDLNQLKEKGFLDKHSGPVTTLSYSNDNHLLSGSEDGKIVVWRSTDWEPLKSLTGHKYVLLPILHVSVDTSVSHDEISMSVKKLRSIPTHIIFSKT